MKKTVAVILNMLILLGLSTGISFCFCAENDECKTTDILQSGMKDSNSFKAPSNIQISVKDCCSDCYKYSDVDVLTGTQIEINPLEEAILFFSASCLKKLVSYSEVFDSKRGPPKVISSNWSEVFIKTERILI